MSMDMPAALEWAADYAERAKIFEPVTNARGYADGWKPPTPEDKRRIIMELAASVVENGGESEDRKFLRRVLHNLNEARIDGADPTGHIDAIRRAVDKYLEGK